MDKVSFGEVLRQTRERKGLDLNETARRLRIRPDILQAIEDSDFSTIPPRGYARNMVNGYARYLGLNPTEITGMYLDELYAYQVEYETSRMRPTGIDMPETAASARAASRSSSRHTFYEREERLSAQNRVEDARTRQSSRTSRSSTRSSSRDRLYPESRTHQARGSVLPSNTYTNLYSGPGPVSFIRTYLPYILAGLAALLILGLIGWLLFGRGSASKAEVEEVPTVPVTGVDTSAPQQPKAPTSFTFEYTVDEGVASWIEVYVDGQIEVGEVVEGPSTRTFSSSNTIQFICANPTGVTAKQDGKEITFEPDEQGMVNITMNFSDILATWLAEHPGVSASPTIPSSTASSAAGTSANAAATNTTTGSEGTPVANTTEGADDTSLGYVETGENTTYDTYDYTQDTYTQDGYVQDGSDVGTYDESAIQDDYTQNQAA